ncbi:MAG: iron ABC transporter permease [Lachnospiraceae bacterium]|nr:iron ABC transporter permease [Lachnospiraceae bacterium]
MKGKKQKSYVRYVLAYCFLLSCLMLLILWNINAGSVEMTMGQVFEILLGHHRQDMNYQIVWDIRIPRILAALILGGALSVAGFLLQTFFGNPIAGPFVLGISSGAKLMVALTMITLLGYGVGINSWSLILAAFAGAVISMGFVLLVSARVKNMSMLIICGVMISYICSAITEFVVTFADDSNIVNLHNWSMGSFSGMNFDKVKIMAAVIGIALLLSFLLAKPMGAYQLGEEYARTLGVNILFLRMSLIFLSSLLAATVTAFAGPISFVGIAVPHLVKGLLKTAKPLVVLPACFLGGAVFCLFCDLIARTVFAPTELSISSVTAVFGAPVVIWLMIRRHDRSA